MSKFKEVLNKKIVKIPLVIIVFVIIIVIWKSLVNSNDSYLEKYDGVDLTADVEGIARDDTYAKYLQSHEGVSSPDEVIDVDVKEFQDAVAPMYDDYPQYKDVIEQIRSIE